MSYEQALVREAARDRGVVRAPSLEELEILLAPRIDARVRPVAVRNADGALLVRATGHPASVEDLVGSYLDRHPYHISGGHMTNDVERAVIAAETAAGVGRTRAEAEALLDRLQKERQQTSFSCRLEGFI